MEPPAHIPQYRYRFNTRILLNVSWAALLLGCVVWIATQVRGWFILSTFAVVLIWLLAFLVSLASQYLRVALDDGDAFWSRATPRWREHRWSHVRSVDMRGSGFVFTKFDNSRVPLFWSQGNPQPGFTEAVVKHLRELPFPLSAKVESALERAMEKLDRQR